MGDDRGAPVEISPDVVSRRVGDELVIVNLSTNDVVALNATGARAWELLSEGLDPAAVADGLVGEYDVTPEAASREVEEMVARLVREGVLVDTRSASSD